LLVCVLNKLEKAVVANAGLRDEEAFLGRNIYLLDRSDLRTGGIMG